ncbi:MAG: GNAT family N-acetyltransferase [Pseudomonadota bacterium]
MTAIRLIGQTLLPDIPILETERLRLRHHRITDLDALSKMWADDNFVRFIGGKRRSQADVWKTLQSTIGGWALLGYGYWAIETKGDGTLIGEMGFLEGLRPIEPSHIGTPEAGWAISPDQWGKGYATEALQAALVWADGIFPEKRTVCMIEKDHKASIRVAEKCGYTLAYDSIIDDDPIHIFERKGP